MGDGRGGAAVIVGKRALRRNQCARRRRRCCPWQRSPVPQVVRRRRFVHARRRAGRQWCVIAAWYTRGVVRRPWCVSHEPGCGGMPVGGSEEKIKVGDAATKTSQPRRCSQRHRRSVPPVTTLPPQQRRALNLYRRRGPRLIFSRSGPPPLSDGCPVTSPGHNSA